MNLTDEERNELAEVLSERLEGFPVRRATAEGAGLVETDVGGEPVIRWRQLIDRAIDKGKLIALLKSAANHSPGDTALERLYQGAERGQLILPDLPLPKPPWRALAMGAAGVAIIAVAIFAGLRFMDEIAAYLPTPAPAPVPGEVVPGEPAPGVPVRDGMHGTPLPPKPVPHVAPAPVEPEEPAPVAPSGRYIRIPDPTEQPAPAPAPAPAPPP